MTKKWNPDEPGRQWLHRQMLERLHGQDMQIDFLLTQFRDLQKRVEHLESRDAVSHSDLDSNGVGQLRRLG